MSDNVWEWCQDRYGSDYYITGANENPAGPSEGSLRVNRGGSWIDVARICRAAYRSPHRPVVPLRQLRLSGRACPRSAWLSSQAVRQGLRAEAACCLIGRIKAIAAGRSRRHACRSRPPPCYFSNFSLYKRWDNGKIPIHLAGYQLLVVHINSHSIHEER